MDKPHKTCPHVLFLNENGALRCAFCDTEIKPTEIKHQSTSSQKVLIKKLAEIMLEHIQAVEYGKTEKTFHDHAEALSLMLAALEVSND